MSWFRLILVLSFIGQAASISAQGLACPDPQKPMIEVELLFGRNIGGRLGVGEAQWRRFVAREVTPRFPDGLTVFNAAGQWFNPGTKRVVREPSKIVRIFVPAAAQEKLDAIVAAYKSRFKQQSVGVVTRPACVAF